MRKDIYKQLVSIIDRHRTWIEVADVNHYEVASVERYGTVHTTVCRSLVLEVFRAGKEYGLHHRWSVSEYELDKALAAYRKHIRIEKRGDDKHKAVQLTPKDVEEIIQVATHGVVHLHLCEEPIYTTYKHHRL